MGLEYPQFIFFELSSDIFTSNLPRMKKLLALSILLTCFALPAHADDCIEKACIDVYTQDGKIVIEGRKGSGPVVKKSVAPAPTKTRKAVIRKPTIPKPKVTGSSKPKVATATRKPVVRKRPKPAVTTSATSLSDKLVELLPTTGIAYSPSFQPLIKVPVYFWCDIPQEITKKMEVVGEAVTVKLKPTFIWHYGDGIFFATNSAGAPYPDGDIQHSYAKPGHYLIELITRWQGTFTVGGATAPIPGKIDTVSVLPITLVAAPSRFTPPVLYSR
jgi:hypothetical protein